MMVSWKQDIQVNKDTFVRERSVSSRSLMISSSKTAKLWSYLVVTSTITYHTLRLNVSDSICTRHLMMVWRAMLRVTCLTKCS